MKHLRSCFLVGVLALSGVSGVSCMCERSGGVSGRAQLPEAEGLEVSPPGLRQISWGYTLQHRTQPTVENWHLMTLGGGFQLPWITLLARINYGQALSGGLRFFGTSHFQYQLYGYLLPGTPNTVALSYGISGSRLFPRHVALAEYYHFFGNAWSVSGGFKLIDWQRVFPTLTFSVNRSIEDWFHLSLRSWLLLPRGGCYPSFVFGIEKSFFGGLNRVKLAAVYGLQLEDLVQIPAFPTVYRYDNAGIHLTAEQVLSDYFVVRVGVSYRNEEYERGVSRNVFGLRLQLTYSF